MQFLEQGQYWIVRYPCERTLRRVGLRSHGVWRSECCESVFVGCPVDLLKSVEIPQVQFLDIYCGADRGRVNATDHEGLLGFADFVGHLCQSYVLGVPESPGVYSQVTRHRDSAN